MNKAVSKSRAQASISAVHCFQSSNFSWWHRDHRIVNSKQKGSLRSYPEVKIEVEIFQGSFSKPYETPQPLNGFKVQNKLSLRLCFLQQEKTVWKKKLKQDNKRLKQTLHHLKVSSNQVKVSWNLKKR